MYPQGCGGSSPFFGTITFGILHLEAGDTYSDTTFTGGSPLCPIENAISPNESVLIKVCVSALLSCPRMAA